MDKKKLDQLIVIWQQTVNVQMHFNELSLKIRNFIVTFLGGIIVAVAYLHKEQVSIEIINLKFNAGIILILAGLLILLAIKLMDNHWYHQLLIGSVKSGLTIEDIIMKELGEDSISLLTNQIKKDSKKVRLWPIPQIKPLFKGKFKYAHFDSSKRMNMFYILLFSGYIIMSTGFIWSTTTRTTKISKSSEATFKYYDTMYDSLAHKNISIWVKE